MKFNPKSEKEIQESRLLPAGVYGFVVVNAEDAISKAGNEMIKLKLKLIDQDGNDRGTLFDYLMATSEMEYKLRHAAEASGLLERYEQGELTADDFHMREGQVKLVVRTSKDPQYPDQNSVADYVVSKSFAHGQSSTPSRQVGALGSGAASKSAAPGSFALEDEIPF